MFLEALKSEVTKDVIVALGYRKKQLGVKLITLNLVHADLVYAIKVFAKELNCRLQIQSGLTSTVNVQIHGTPAEVALAQILRIQ